ncbi:MAG: hypothetical protein BWY57_00741 [Betaproteobacteria bacterium ADurb.Bin341]|nr:MAG: hypothetical protein BWY57_00741 [Betaproteobacteria bacterium ADurb.Bin341]
MVLHKWIALSGLSVLLAASAHAQSLYCCQDAATGRRNCGDTLPHECKGLAYKILDRAGNVIREVGPPLTAEQKAALQAEEEQKREHEAAMREQRRKDAALLETYSSVQDIDISLARAETELVKAMDLAEGRIKAAWDKRKKLESEAEFYKKGTLPPEIARGLRDADDEIRAYSDVLKSKKADLEKIRAKYAADKQRYLEILSGGGLLSHPDAKRPATPQK